MYGATGYQTLNIVETSVEPEVSQVDEQDEYNVHYGTNSTSNNMGHKSKQKVTNQPHQKQQTSTPNKIKILTRDQFDPSNKTQNLNSPCMLCNSSNHPTHRCLQTRQLRDKKQPVPSNFCETHCGKVYALCNKKACAIIKTKAGKLLNLTCQKPNHGNKHFLLCDIESCRKISEKYWKKLQERNQVVHLIPAEDLEVIDSEPYLMRLI